VPIGCERGDGKPQRLSHKYQPDDLFVSYDDQSYVGLKFDTQQVILGRKDSDFIFLFSQITSVEVVQDGVSITKTNRGSQLVGGAVGALALGGIGAIVGGLTGSTRSSSNVRSILLKVLMDDRNFPAFSICFLNTQGEKGYEKDSDPVKNAQAKVERLHGHLLNGMRQVESEARVAARPPAIAETGKHRSDAEDLQQLWKLKQEGILTDDEFQQQKTRILRGLSFGLASAGGFANTERDSLPKRPLPPHPWVTGTRTDQGWQGDARRYVFIRWFVRSFVPAGETWLLRDDNDAAFFMPASGLGCLPSGFGPTHGRYANESSLLPNG
jgi:hypothetical protein